MGEREITEHIEVTEEEMVHYCDFGGRSSQEFDGIFHNIYIGGSIDYPNRHKPVKTDGDTVIVDGWIENGQFGMSNADEKHLCDECYGAYVEVHNDED